MILTPQLDPSSLEGKYIYLDTDFLSQIFRDPELLEASLALIQGYRVIDPMTRLEFLRDVYLPELRSTKEAFLDSELFVSGADHQTLFARAKENAITLSRIYAQKSKAGASLVDLLLAGTLMMYKNSVLVTGNKKDFPSFIFDTLGVITFEQQDGGMRTISIVEFNSEKYEKCREEYEKIRPPTKQ